MKRHQSLRTKLVWSALICFLFPLIVIYIVTNYFTRDIILEKVIANAKDSLKVAETEINGLFEDTLTLSNFVLMNSELRQMLSTNRDALQPEEQRRSYSLAYSQLSRSLDELFMPKNDYDVTILGTKDAFYTNYSHSDYDPTRLYGEDWFPNLSNREMLAAYWRGDISRVTGGKSHTVTMGRAIRSATYSPIGYIVIDMNERLIRPYLNGGADQEMMLIDSAGRVMSHSDPARIGKKLDWWPLEKEKQTVETDGETYIIVQQTLESNGWHVVNLIPLNPAIQKNKQVLSISFIVQALFFTLFFLLLTVRISAILKPITSLSKFVTSIGRGQLGSRNGIRTNNEVGQLARTIDYMLDRIEFMIQQITVEQSKKRKAELEMLQAQINPHFMFNLLNSIRMNILVRGDKENAELIGSLSSLLRMTIDRDNAYIPLREEVATIDHYMKLMNFRHANQIQLVTRFDDECGETLVPRFMIQPLIENAIIHGFEQQHGEIYIAAGRVNEDGKRLIRISVTDNGAGMSEEQLEKLRKQSEEREDGDGEGEARGFSGIGVKNVFQRLRLIYGTKFKSWIQSEPGIGTAITLQFPIEVESAGETYVESHIGR
ncbi:cache domain-containing sensor histidine kinase [Paenibacillus sp. 2TAB19]|uniref:cache domain-containing sensor histidine kinase n=1 Tax=Paenibacillus sp. 2TAB19 TaxID=3233003 RepID=UPI003F95E51E